MPTKVLRADEDVDKLARLLSPLKKPITVSWTKGAPRSAASNRLAQRWFTDIAMQLGDQTHEEVRALCKLTIGVPILRAENEAFRLAYDRVMGELPYADKLAAIQALDLPVTRLMTLPQMTEFMDQMTRTWSAQGVRLTDPRDLMYLEEFGEPVA